MLRLRGGAGGQGQLSSALCGATTVKGKLGGVYPLADQDASESEVKGGKHQLVGFTGYRQTCV